MTPIKVNALKQTCGVLAQDLLETKSATLEVVRAVTPGGDDNPKRDASAWLRFYGQLQLLRGRAQGGGGPSADPSPAVRAADALTLAALAETPRPVPSLPGHSVYPKSFAALLHCHAREILVGHLARVVGRANRRDPPKAILGALSEATAELSYQTRLLAWIATSAGPALPFPETVAAPDLPEDVVELSAIAVLDINRLFAAVNWSSLRAMEALITPPDDDDGRARLAWSPFFGSLAIELHESPSDLLRARSLASVLASTQLAASTHREAMAEAKAKSERERPTRARNN
jgi:hypothetical protein